MAMPSPLSCPVLRRMEARERWPKITAGIPANTLNRIESTPKTMLTAALGSVSGRFPAFCVCSCTGVNVSPHFGQNCEGAASFAPPFEHTTSPLDPENSGENRHLSRFVAEKQTHRDDSRGTAISCDTAVQTNSWLSSNTSASQNNTFLPALMHLPSARKRPRATGLK